MSLSMLDNKAAREQQAEWPAAIRAEFDREARQHNGCVGTELLSETDRVRVWIIRLGPGERVGFHRHVLDYFWTSVNGGRARQHLMDGSTVELSYAPGETRHETYGPGEYKVHDLENLGSEDMIFNTIEFLDSANQPLPIPDSVRRQA
jgi:beta-alanine degradation protein BauB